MVQEYELMLLTDAEIDDSARTTIIDRAKEAVAKGGGSWLRVDDWGRRKMAYEIAKKADAHYSLMFFDCDGETLDEAVRVLRITDGVMRVMGVNRVPPPPEGAKLDPPEPTEEDRERPRGRGGRGRGPRR